MLEFISLQVTCGFNKGSCRGAGVLLPSLSLSRAPQNICIEDIQLFPGILFGFGISLSYTCLLRALPSVMLKILGVFMI